VASNSSGVFVPTTRIIDAGEIREAKVGSEQFKDILINLTETINSMSSAINNKVNGTMDTRESISGNQFFPDPTLDSSSETTPIERPEYRKVINFGVLDPTGTTKNVAHGISVTSNTIFTRIYGTATRSTAFLSITIPAEVNAAIGTPNVKLSVDETNVRIDTNPGDWSDWYAIVVLEYLK